MLAATPPRDGTAVSGLQGTRITLTGGSDDQLSQEPDRLLSLLGRQRLKTRLAEEKIVRSKATVALTAAPGRSLDVVLGLAHTGASRTLNERSIRRECQAPSRLLNAIDARSTPNGRGLTRRPGHNSLAWHDAPRQARPPTVGSTRRRPPGRRRGG